MSSDAVSCPVILLGFDFTGAAALLDSELGVAGEVSVVGVVDLAAFASLDEIAGEAFDESFGVQPTVPTPQATNNHPVVTHKNDRLSLTALKSIVHSVPRAVCSSATRGHTLPRM